MLDIFVNTNKLTIKDPIIASDTIEYLTCKVHYESELWEEYDEITAFISNGTTSYSVPVVDGVISEDNKIKVSEGMWTIYIQGTSGGAVVLFTNADILWVTKPGGIEGYPYIKVPADISFQSYLIAKNAEYFALNAGGGSAFKGEVATLPEKANKGEIYKLTTESVPTGKLFIKVSGVNVIEQDPSLENGDVYTGATRLDIDTNTDIYQFLLYAKMGHYSEFGVSFDSYIENAGVKYTVPWITTSSFGNDSDDILINTNKSFEALLTNGTTLVCYADDMTYLPQTLKDNFIKYPAGTCFVYDGTKWVALDSAVLAELLMRVSRGTSGAMVFIDEVEALPEKANEGEVYSVNGIAPNWHSLVDNGTASCQIIVSKYNGVEAETRNGGTNGTLNAICNIPSDYWYGNKPFKMRFSGNNKTSIVEVTFFECSDVPDGTFYLYATGTASEDITFNIGDTISVDYATEEVSISGTYVYHKGKWVKLWGGN